MFFKTTVTLLLLVNIGIAVAASVVIYKNVSEQHDVTVNLTPEEEYLEFKKEVYTTLSQLVMGQTVLDSNMLRIHHFVEPHSDKFYEGCQECNKERSEMLRDRIPIDMRKSQ